MLRKNIKAKTCRSTILSVVWCRCESVLILKEKCRLRVFENRALRMMFGPKGGSGEDYITGGFVIPYSYQILLE